MSYACDTSVFALVTSGPGIPLSSCKCIRCPRYVPFVRAIAASGRLGTMNSRYRGAKPSVTLFVIRKSHHCDRVVSVATIFHLEETVNLSPVPDF